MKTQNSEKRQMTPDVIKNLKKDETIKFEKSKEVINKIEKNNFFKETNCK